MENISLRFLFELANGDTHKVTIKDVKPSVTESEVIALGNKLIEKGCHHKKSLFTRLLKSTKVNVTEESF